MVIAMLLRPSTISNLIDISIALINTYGLIPVTVFLGIGLTSFPFLSVQTISLIVVC